MTPQLIAGIITECKFRLVVKFEAWEKTLCVANPIAIGLYVYKHIRLEEAKIFCVYKI